MVSTPHKWALECLLCGAEPNSPEINQERRRSHGDLVAFQEHAMVYHQITLDDFVRQTRTPPLEMEGHDFRSYKWRLPDGQNWLRATRVDLKPVSMTDGPKSAEDYIREQRR